MLPSVLACAVLHLQVFYLLQNCLRVRLTGAYDGVMQLKKLLQPFKTQTWHCSEHMQHCRFGNNCKYSHAETSLVKLLRILRTARRSLSICVFSITLDDIANTLLDLHRQGVNIRIITDDDQVFALSPSLSLFLSLSLSLSPHTCHHSHLPPQFGHCSSLSSTTGPAALSSTAETYVQSASQGSDIHRLAQAGIHCVTDNSSYHMHHKFAILDNATLLNGSLNWTMQGVKSNQENVVVTTDPALIREFSHQFEGMWRKFSGNRVR